MKKESSEISTPELWERYAANRDAETRNLLVCRYLHLVKMAAERVSPYLPESVDREELVGAGTLGLMQAIEKFDKKYGAKFETYCMTRIRGSILDDLRQADWMSRPLRTKAHKVRQAVAAMQHDLGREPSDHEVADILGLSDQEYQLIALHASSPANCSIHARRSYGESVDVSTIDILTDDKSPNPIDVLQRREISEIVSELIRSLPATDRLVILLYYYDRLTMKQIGKVLRITESRICQVHNEVLSRLQRRLRSKRDELMSAAV